MKNTPFLENSFNSKPKNIVYTCVIGNYDKLYPPICDNQDIRYVALTDNPKLKAPGWELRLIENQSSKNSSLTNRHCKLFPWKYLPEATNSIYVDGNIRIISTPSRLFDLVKDECDIALFRHPDRNFVLEEIEACARHGKVQNQDIINKEYQALLDDGFIDQGRLTENGVIIRSHKSAKLRAAMEMWWSFVHTYSGRDQISLHHCLAKTAVKPNILPINFRERNPFFNLYPHAINIKNPIQKLDIHLSARRSEGTLRQIQYATFRKLCTIPSKTLKFLKNCKFNI
jgi:hypothetical protein|tara:strand:+ start:258 stop:1112 length:855 start_codon:yes stop_codon:yes gene_type:complete